MKHISSPFYFIGFLRMMASLSLMSYCIILLTVSLSETLSFDQFQNSLDHKINKRNANENKGPQRTMVYKETSKSTYGDGTELEAAVFIEGAPDGRVRALQITSDPKNGTRALTAWQGEKDRDSAAFIEKKPDGHLKFVHYTADTSKNAKVTEKDNEEKTTILDPNEDSKNEVSVDEEPTMYYDDDDDDGEDDEHDRYHSSLKKMFMMKDDESSPPANNIPSHLNEKMSAFNFLFLPSPSAEDFKYVENDPYYEAIAESIRKESHGELYYPYLYKDFSRQSAVQMFPSIYDKLYVNPANRESQQSQTKPKPTTHTKNGFNFPTIPLNDIYPKHHSTMEDNKNRILPKDEKEPASSKDSLSINGETQKKNEYKQIVSDINTFLKQIRSWLKI